MTTENFNKQEFASLYRIYYKRMFGLCMKYAKNEEVAKDLVQDSFVTILMRIDTLKDKGKLESWMFSVAKNTCLKYLEKKKLFSDIGINDFTTLQAEQTIAEEEEPQTISYDTMMDMVEKLPEGYKKVFKLYSIDGLSHKEIAEKLNINSNTSSSQLFRAKKMLKSMIHSYWTLVGLSIIFIVVLLFRFWGGGMQEDKPQITLENHQTLQENNTFLQGENKTLFYSHETKKEFSKTKKEKIKTKFYEIKTKKENDTSYVSEKEDNEQILLTDKIEKQILQNKDTVFENILAKNYPYPTNNEKKNEWSIKVDFSSYLSNANPNNLYDFLPAIPQNINNGMIEEPIENLKIKYHIPITFSLGLNKRINKLFSLEEDFVYSTYKSDIYYQTDRLATYKVSYLGLETKTLYHFVESKFLETNVGFGIGVNIPMQTKFLYEDLPIKKQENTKAKPQCFFSFSLGVSYKINNRFDIFFQPQLNYYLDNSDNVSMYLRKNNLNFNLPIGLRIKL
ncbi:MAG: sigma-70 family RNA polymerase sigma factor [Bacteroidales bacterium]|nr:sigma-70 family RNA polymerase sigma factor [Bacteroidales bacterium]